MPTDNFFYLKLRLAAYSMHVHGLPDLTEWTHCTDHTPHRAQAVLATTLFFFFFFLAPFAAISFQSSLNREPASFIPWLYYGPAGRLSAHTCSVLSAILLTVEYNVNLWCEEAVCVTASCMHERIFFFWHLQCRRWSVCVFGMHAWPRGREKRVWYVGGQFAADSPV